MERHCRLCPPKLTMKAVQRPPAMIFMSSKANGGTGGPVPANLSSTIRLQRSSASAVVATSARRSSAKRHAMTTRTPFPGSEIQKRNRRPWRQASEVTAVTLALEAPALRPGQSRPAGVDLSRNFPPQHIEKPNKSAAFRYPTEVRKPSDIHKNSIEIQLAFRYP